MDGEELGPADDRMEDDGATEDDTIAEDCCGEREGEGLPDDTTTDGDNDGGSEEDD